MGAVRRTDIAYKKGAGGAGINDANDSVDGGGVVANGASIDGLGSEHDYVDIAASDYSTGGFVRDDALWVRAIDSSRVKCARNIATPPVWR